MTKKRVPMYQKIIEAIDDEINSGAWVPGQRVATEDEIAEKFQVSRMTARHALVELERRGVVVRSRAFGTYLAKNKAYRNSDKLLSFKEMFKDHAMEPETCNFVVQPADETLAEVLEIKPGEPVIKSEQLQLVDQSPMSILELYMSYSLCPGITAKDFERSDYYEFLADQYGIDIKYADGTIEAVAASDEQADKLKVSRGFPLLLFCRIAYDDRLLPITYARIAIRSDKYLIRQNLRR